jgi:tryptophan 2,3-dioxygenase
LDGLLYADFLTYWDYIHLDTLLSLQSPKTPFPDEEIFIIYHQITELYFKLCPARVQANCKQQPFNCRLFYRPIKTH